MEKKPFLTKEQAERIARDYPTPFHIYDEAGLRENCRAVKEAFAWNPGFREYFAVKACPNPFLIRIFQEYGFGVDCASEAELTLAKALAFAPEAVMFSSNDTPVREYACAAEMGAVINFDDLSHLPFFQENVGPFPKTACCRYNPGGVYEISNGIMDNPGDAKYGMTKYQLFEAYRLLREGGVERFGLHSFLVSNTVTNDYYPALARTLFTLAAEIKRDLGISLSFINLSGGVGIPYRPGETPNDIHKIGEGVREAYQEILVPAGLSDVAVYTEMGRFMTGPYGALVTTAIHQKHIYKEYVGVDACAVDLMRPAMYGAYHHITVLGKENALRDHIYDVTGSLCENNDKFAVDRELPEISVGDILYIHDTGAHGYAMGYNYNGKLKSPELLLKEDGSVQQIRRGETVADYYRTFDFAAGEPWAAALLGK